MASEDAWIPPSVQDCEFDGQCSWSWTSNTKVAWSLPDPDSSSWEERLAARMLVKRLAATDAPGR